MFSRRTYVLCLIISANRLGVSFRKRILQGSAPTQILSLLHEATALQRGIWLLFRLQFLVLLIYNYQKQHLCTPLGATMGLPTEPTTAE